MDSRPSKTLLSYLLRPTSGLSVTLNRPTLDTLALSSDARMPERRLFHWLSSCPSVAPAMQNLSYRGDPSRDRKSTRLNSSHGYISYAVFCLKKKKKKQQIYTQHTILRAG